MISNLKTDQPYQLFEELNNDDFSALKRDIAARGVLVPVEVDEQGTTLDGHHRIKAWMELRQEGIAIPDYPRIVRVGMSEQEKRTHVRSLNMLRRHLTREQRRQLIAEQVMDTPELSDRQIASSLGVSPTTVGTARKELTEANQVSRLDTCVGADGKIYSRKSTAVFARSIHEEKLAITAIASSQSLPNKMLDLKRAERIAREQKLMDIVGESDIVSSETGIVDIRCGDFSEVLSDIENGSVSLILTDPPYGIEHLGLWNRLAEFASEKLKPGGILVAYSGQFHLPVVMNALGGHLQYVWTISLIGRGPKTQVHARRINSSWKPILVYCKPPYEKNTWIDDIIQGDGPEKSHHNWQQSASESIRLVEMFSQPGDLVVDPFIGSGTSAVAALRLGRMYIGCDVDAGAVRMAVGRVGEEGELHESL